jgi:hypothetical protein
MYLTVSNKWLRVCGMEYLAHVRLQIITTIQTSGGEYLYNVLLPDNRTWTVASWRNVCLYDE